MESLEHLIERRMDLARKSLRSARIAIFFSIIAVICSIVSIVIMFK